MLFVESGAAEAPQTELQFGLTATAPAEVASGRGGSAQPPRLSFFGAEKLRESSR